MGLDGGGRYPSILGEIPEETASPGHSWTPVVRIRNQQVRGSSPRAGSISNQSLRATFRAGVGGHGCSWDARWHRVQPVDGGAVATRHEVAVDVDGDLNRRVPELVPDIHQRLTLLDQQGLTRMPQIVQAHLVKLRLRERRLIDATPKVVAVEPVPHPDS